MEEVGENLIPCEQLCIKVSSFEKYIFSNFAYDLKSWFGGKIKLKPKKVKPKVEVPEVIPEVAEI